MIADSCTCHFHCDLVTLHGPLKLRSLGLHSQLIYDLLTLSFQLTLMLLLTKNSLLLFAFAQLTDDLFPHPGIESGLDLLWIAVLSLGLPVMCSMLWFTCFLPDVEVLLLVLPDVGALLVVLRVVDVLQVVLLVAVVLYEVPLLVLQVRSFSPT